MQDVGRPGLCRAVHHLPPLATKQDVVRAALECEQASEKFTVTGDARADVKSCLTELANGLTGDGAQTFLGFLAVLRSDPEVGQIFVRR